MLIVLHYDQWLTLLILQVILIYRRIELTALLFLIMKNLLTLTLICFSCIVYSQSFEIYNSNTTLMINNSNYLEVVVNVNKDENCCVYSNLAGYLSSTSKDSLSFYLESSQHFHKLDPSRTLLSQNYAFEFPVTTVAKKDIASLIYYKSKKANRSSNTKQIIGGVIMIGGLLTAVNALFIADNKKTELLIAGGVQFSAGIIFGTASNKPTRHFNKEQDSWQFR